MALPNLFIVGAAKSGTTSLHNYLNQHQDVFMCNPKEPHYLINQEIGVNRIPVGITNFIEYIDLFLEGKDKKYRGESSVMYLMYPEIVIPKIPSLSYIGSISIVPLINSSIITQVDKIIDKTVINNILKIILFSLLKKVKEDPFICLNVNQKCSFEK